MDSFDGFSSNIKSDYHVLARKYRPRLFKDIVAQEHIVRVIRNSLVENKLHHAFLLTGIRGSGKTTLARLMAKAINCENVTKNEEIEPCLHCASCTAIASGNQQDIIEIDAASNTGVSDVREIIENAKYQPIGVNYKIFIIDEVHMLSNSAFNALLKSLEEPPLHAKFILATTELHKVPLTIISRCQRLDLRRFNFKDLVFYLEKIARLENFTLDKLATQVLAKAAQGSARDVLSMLDQALLYNNDSHIKVSDVEKMLGISSVDEVFKIFSALLVGDIKSILESIRSLYDKGASLVYVLQDLAEIAHKISLCKLEVPHDIFISDVEKSFCRKHEQDISIVTLTRLWQMLQKAISDVKNATNDLVSVEMSMIKMVHANLTVSPEEILNSLEQSDAHEEITEKKSNFNSFESLLDFLMQNNEISLSLSLQNELSIVEYKNAQITVNLDQSSEKNLKKIGVRMTELTGCNWNICIDNGRDGIIYGINKKNQLERQNEKLLEHNLVKKIIEIFPEVEIDVIKND